MQPRTLSRRLSARSSILKSKLSTVPRISEGIRDETRNITSKMREYSQGSIQNFEVLETTQDGGIVRVSAKVGVRIEDFRAYIKRAVEGDVAISKGLFAQAATEQQQKSDAGEILVDRVIDPIVGNVGVSLTPGAPQKIDPENLPCSISFDATRKLPQCSSNFSLWMRLHQADQASIYRIPVTLSIARETVEQIRNIATTISNNNCARVTIGNRWEVAKALGDSLGRAGINIGDGNQGRRYSAIMTRAGMSSYGDVCFTPVSDIKKYLDITNKFKDTRLELSILGKDGVLIEQYIYHPFANLGNPALVSSIPRYGYIAQPHSLVLSV